MRGRFRPRAGTMRGRGPGVMGRAVSTVMALAVLGGTAGEAGAVAPAKQDGRVVLSRVLAELSEEAPVPPPAGSALDRISDERDRQLVEDFAEFDEEEEVREAARAALASSDPNAVR
ncbi:hypothetical protein E2C00_21380, partial [Streptomyces sp. WAC05374]|uniref:hypothetical protein n=1 Tax=Streptomyces sp. WAC05374 TaxID=2487420 RepID=UPI000F92EB2A